MEENKHIEGLQTDIVGMPLDIPTHEPAMTPSPVPAKIRVLLVDDSEDTRRFLTMLLGMEPGVVPVGQAGDGLTALLIAKALYPDVIIMDVDMPKLNGIEATRRILSELKNTRVIGFSSDDSEEARTQMLAAGASAYLVKGVSGTNDKLVAAVKQAAVS